MLRGLNWGHRRATGPMNAAAARFAPVAPDDARIAWDVQPLSGFEHGLGPALVDRYDLIVFDHPFCGAIARDGLLRPLDGALSPLRDEDFVGPSLSSYRYAGALWALPIDGATQVAVYRPDLIGDHGEVPRTWSDVIALGRAARRDGQWLGLACLNPHAALVLAALCAHLGAPWSPDPEAEPFDPVSLRSAIGALREVLEFVHPDCLGFNAIDLHEAMVARDDLIYCPLAYGYLTYGEADGRRPLRFADFPALAGSAPCGTVLGGTGLGLTRSCRDVDAAHRFLAMLASGPAQVELVAGHHGQPGHVAAWNDPAVDARYGGAFSATRATVDAAWVRPRFPGYIQVQHACGDLVAGFCAGALNEAELAERLVAAWRASAPPLDRSRGTTKRTAAAEG
jgi:multiple sugar transport system substrate-binding protein